ncbi:hypothetical protein KIW84_064147 [Lathyrus oleraceus]|uniref:Uncharacterized protein n=1 Tax=Pisum sativum TaxID=3888 RepID=A0A9D4WBT5_PEA|nr:hypothetical protein KIW84_064147 [Pisum sativum]
MLEEIQDGESSLVPKRTMLDLILADKGNLDVDPSNVGLVDKQTGVGWDHEKNNITTDDDWWAEKSKEDPNILKWKHGGPKFIDFLDKYFKGAIATGFSLYKPYED